MTQTRRATLRQIFADAWAVARQAARRFGGAARQYFAEALREIYEMLATPAPAQRPLIDRTVKTAYATITITGLREWTSDDGRRVRTYVEIDSDDVRKGPVGIYIVHQGDANRGHLEVQTPFGIVAYARGVFCNSGAKHVAAHEAIQALFG